MIDLHRYGHEYHIKPDQSLLSWVNTMLLYKTHISYNNHELSLIIETRLEV